MIDNQLPLFDPQIAAAEERHLFGDKVRPMRPELDEEGDFLYGTFLGVDRGVDLHNGFDPVDIWNFEAISGALAGYTKAPQRGRQYAIAAMHVTLRNRLAELDPQPEPGERMAIRRGRMFLSKVEGPSKGRYLVSWDVVMPDREPTPPKPTSRRKAGFKPVPEGSGDKAA